MISYLEGTVLFVEPDCIAIKTHGVGYNVWLNKIDLANLITGQDIELFIHTHVREDALELFGFSSLEKKQIFMSLISVSGIGPKLGLAILSAISVHSLVDAIVNKDLASLSKIPGIGKKTAERMCLELKEKVIKLGLSLPHSSATDQGAKRSLEQAIRGLGYTKHQSDQALESLSPDDLNALPLEDLIKKTLKVLLGNTPS